MQSGSYEKDAVKHYTLEAVVENVEFFGSKKDNNNAQPSPYDAFSQGNVEEELQPVDDNSMPF